MNETSIDLAPQFSFKPIEMVDGSGSDCSVVEEDVDRIFGNVDSETEPSTPTVRTANSSPPVHKEQSVNNGKGRTTSQIISPYPYNYDHAAPCNSSTTKEMETGNESTNTMPLPTVTEPPKPAFYVDYTRFFFESLGEEHGEPLRIDESMDCDDFSVTSREANSIADDLEHFSENPASFWERASPTEISVGSDEPSSTNNNKH